MKLWVDDVRPMPTDYTHHAYSVDAAIMMIDTAEEIGDKIELIDLDHDAGDYAKHGGDFINILDYLVAAGRDYPIKLHTMNPVGRENMRAIIRRNNWIEVL
jgi:hypothetical protein